MTPKAKPRKVRASGPSRRSARSSGRTKAQSSATDLNARLAPGDSPFPFAEATSFDLSLLAHVGDAVIATDPDLRITAWNAGAEAMYGWRASEVVGRSVSEILRSEFTPGQRAEALEALRTKGQLRVEVRTYHKDGRPVDVEGVSIALQGHAGETLGYVAVNRDISERRKSEDRLRAHEARFRALIEGSPDALVLLDRHGEATYVSPSVERILGFSPHELGRTGLRLDLVHPDDRPHLEGDLQGALARPRHPVRATYRVQHRNGSWRWVEASVTNRLDDPVVGAIVCHVQDVTERVEAEEKQRASESRYRLLFDANPVPMWAFDLETLAFLAVNEAAVRHYGFSRKEFLEMTLAHIRPAEDVPALRETQRAVLQGMLTLEEGGWGIQRHRKKDGTVIEVEFTENPISLQGRRAVLVALHDITERRRAEAAAREQRVLAEALRDTATALNTTLDYDEVLDRILQNVGRVLEYDTVDIMLLESAVARIVRTFGFERFGIRSSDAQRMEFPLGQFENLRQIAESGRGRAVSDTTAFSPWVPIQGFEWVRSYVGAPIRVHNQVIGFLNLSSSRPSFYDEKHAHKLQAFADQAAVALKNSRLHREVRHSRERLESLSHQLLEVQESERRSIARELHDEIGQVLTGLKLTLEMASTDRGEDGQGGLEDAVAGVNDLMDRVHGLILDLRPSMLDDLGLVPALLAHFERYTSQTGVQVRFEHRGLDRRFPSQIETAAYRIVQEALTNVARHAGVREVRVLTWSDGEAVGVQVEDSGKGFDQAQALGEPSHSGLAGMRERAVLLGGRVDFDTAPGAGTRVAALIPLTATLERREHPRRP